MRRITTAAAGRLLAWLEGGGPPRRHRLLGPPRDLENFSDMKQRSSSDRTGAAAGAENV